MSALSYSNSKEVSQIDPRSLYLVTEMGRDSNGLKRAYLTWQSDSQGHYPKIDELDLTQLGLDIVKTADGSLGHGWIFYRP
jgi:hypothetical protein